MLSVEWVTVQVRWRKERGGGVNGPGPGPGLVPVVEPGLGEVVGEEEYLLGRRRVMGWFVGFDVGGDDAMIIEKMDCDDKVGVMVVPMDNIV
jgi:hypothetical protein